MNENITEQEVIQALEARGLRYQVRGRYIVSQCPKHDDRTPSAQIFKDDWFVSCLSGCGRFHVTDPFPELRAHNEPTLITRRPAIATVREYQEFELTEYWEGLPLIPREHTFKNIPLHVLDDLGWRWDEPKNSYFIPYFDTSHSKIPFAQWRHLSGSRRFTFLAGAKPTLYGKWNVSPGDRLFICEGASDAAVLERCGVPWIAAPSAASGTLVEAFAAHAKLVGVSLVYAGDNDTAGEALRQALDASGAAYRICQPPKTYKDWGEFYMAKGQLAVFDWCKEKLFE